MPTQLLSNDHLFPKKTHEKGRRMTRGTLQTDRQQRLNLMVSEKSNT